MRRGRKLPKPQRVDAETARLALMCTICLAYVVLILFCLLCVCTTEATQSAEEVNDDFDKCVRFQTGRFDEEVKDRCIRMLRLLSKVSSIILLIAALLVASILPWQIRDQFNGINVDEEVLGTRFWRCVWGLAILALPFAATAMLTYWADLSWLTALLVMAFVQSVYLLFWVLIIWLLLNKIVKWVERRRLAGSIRFGVARVGDREQAQQTGEDSAEDEEGEGEENAQDVSLRTTEEWVRMLSVVNRRWRSAENRNREIVEESAQHMARLSALIGPQPGATGATRNPSAAGSDTDDSDDSDPDGEPRGQQSVTTSQVTRTEGLELQVKQEPTLEGGEGREGRVDSPRSRPGPGSGPSAITGGSKAATKSTLKSVRKEEEFEHGDRVDSTRGPAELRLGLSGAALPFGSVPTPEGIVSSGTDTRGAEWQSGVRNTDRTSLSELNVGGLEEDLPSAGGFGSNTATEPVKKEQKREEEQEELTRTDSFNASRGHDSEPTSPRDVADLRMGESGSVTPTQLVIPRRPEEEQTRDSGGRGMRGLGGLSAEQEQEEEDRFRQMLGGQRSARRVVDPRTGGSGYDVPVELVSPLTQRSRPVPDEGGVEQISPRAGSLGFDTPTETANPPKT